MAKQLRAELTRESIVVGAAETFERFGYGSASLSDVIAQAKVTKGALYFHFSSKEELARAVIDAQHEMTMASVKEILERKAPALNLLMGLSREMTRQLLEEPVVRAGVRLTLEHGTFRTISDPYREWMETTEQLVRRAQEEKDVKDGVSPEEVARFFVAAFTGVQLVSQVMTNRRDLGRRVHEMWQLLLPALVQPSKLPHFHNVAAAELGA